MEVELIQICSQEFFGRIVYHCGRGQNWIVTIFTQTCQVFKKKELHILNLELWTFCAGGIHTALFRDCLMYALCQKLYFPSVSLQTCRLLCHVSGTEPLEITCIHAEETFHVIGPQVTQSV